MAPIGLVGPTARSRRRAGTTPTAVDPQQVSPRRPVCVQMELIDEQYAFGPDESLHLVYRLTGDLESVDLTVPEPVRHDRHRAPHRPPPHRPGSRPNRSRQRRGRHRHPGTTTPSTTTVPPPPLVAASPSR